jgi:tRNA pseudouridine38-40 synthase
MSILSKTAQKYLPFKMQLFGIFATMEELLTETENEPLVQKHPRYFIHLAYDGTGFHGWQIQKNGDSVQERVNSALSQILNSRIMCMGCGRTDAGVHATSFYAHFDFGGELPHRFVDRLNSILPKSIVVFNIMSVAQNAHTRFHATKRSYEYYIHFEKNPFLKSYSLYLGHLKTNWDIVFEATEMLTTFKDFTSLCRPSDDFKTNLCDVSLAKWDRVQKPSVAGPKQNEFMRFTISSNRFLRGMVRKTVGTLLMLGADKISLQEFEDTIANQQEFFKTSLVSPEGLYLTDVVYPYSLEPIVWV